MSGTATSRVGYCTAAEAVCFGLAQRYAKTEYDEKHAFFQ
jgi:hypothetical protein